MNTYELINQLESNSEIFKTLLRLENSNFPNYRIAHDKWNLTEIVSHLYDEEREDFRARLLHVYGNKKGAFVPIDPENWVLSRNYSKNDFYTKLNSFLEERKHSVERLRMLHLEGNSNFLEHQHFGKMTCRSILVNWLAHDLFHIRQITNYRISFLESESGINLNYAKGL